MNEASNRQEIALLDPRRTFQESVELGRAKREEVPLSVQARWDVQRDRALPLDLLRQQAAVRIQDLIPLRYERMSASAFTFYRGNALLMAADLSTTPSTGLDVQMCGDAHIGNFGGFASPERRLIFSLNDFDESLPGPWEWDLKRLVTSVEICCRDREFDRNTSARMVRACSKSYRKALQEFAQMSNLDVWYAHFDIAEHIKSLVGNMDKKTAKTVEKQLDKARGKDNAKAAQKLTKVVDGQLRIISDPPFLVPIEELFPPVEAKDIRKTVGELIDVYISTLTPDRQHLLRQYTYVDMARKVVGVGSVGTRCWIVLLQGKDENDPLVLQFKEAEPSVLESFLGSSTYTNHGQRVVEGQRHMQAVSDIMLGWFTRIDEHGVARDYYVRQLWDWKTSPDLETISAIVLDNTAKMAAWTLARAHARSGDRIAMAQYVAQGKAFDETIAAFAVSYADQNQVDYDVFVNALAENDGMI